MFSLKTMLRTALATRLKRKDAAHVTETIEQAWNVASNSPVLAGDIENAAQGIEALMRLNTHGFWIVPAPALGRAWLVVRTSKFVDTNDPAIKSQLDALGTWEVIDAF